MLTMKNRSLKQGWAWTHQLSTSTAWPMPWVPSPGVKRVKGIPKTSKLMYEWEDATMVSIRNKESKGNILAQARKKQLPSFVGPCFAHMMSLLPGEGWVCCSSGWCYIVLCLTQINLVSLKSFQDEHDLTGHYFKIFPAADPIVDPEIAPFDMRLVQGCLVQGFVHFRTHHTKSCIFIREERLMSSWKQRGSGEHLAVSESRKCNTTVFLSLPSLLSNCVISNLPVKTPVCCIKQPARRLQSTLQTWHPTDGEKLTLHGNMARTQLWRNLCFRN